MRVAGFGIFEIIIFSLVLAAVIVAVVLFTKKRSDAVPSIQRRFCTQCGTELPGTATFCTQCGTALPPIPTLPVRATPSNPFNPLSIAGRVCAGITIIAMFLPWLEVPAMRSLGNYASAIGIRVQGDFSYPMYGMGDVTKTLDMLSSSNAFSGIQLVFLGLWVIALALLVVGLIRSFVGNKSTGLLLAGGIVAALVAILWFAAIMYVNGEFSRQLAQLTGSRVQFFEIPLAVWVTFIVGIAAGVLGFIGRNKA